MFISRLLYIVNLISHLHDFVHVMNTSIFPTTPEKIQYFDRWISIKDMAVIRIFLVNKIVELVG